MNKLLVLLLFINGVPLATKGTGVVGSSASPASFGMKTDGHSWITMASDGSLLISLFDQNDRENGGALFRYNTADSTLTPVTRFNDTNGAWPNGTLCEAPAGFMYGVTYKGGDSNRGTIYSLDLKTNTHKTIFSFGSSGPRHPGLGLFQLSEHEFLGVCDTSVDGVPADPYNLYRCTGLPYLFNTKNNTVTWFQPVAGQGTMQGLPVRLNEDIAVMFFRGTDANIITEYSVSQKKFVSTTEINFTNDPISGLVKASDTSFYFMNYYTESEPSTFPFVCYNAKTKKCSRVKRGSAYLTLYSGDFTSDGTGNLYGCFKMGIEYGDPVLFCFETGADSLYTLPKKHYPGTKFNHYDFLSNTVVSSSGRLYAIDWQLGLVEVALSSASVKVLAR